MRLKLCTGLVAFCIVSSGISAQNVELSGSVQTAGVAGRSFGDFKTTHRFTRYQARAESGNWKAVASLWDYDFCNWRDLDETNIAYSWNDRQIKLGRFLNPVGMSTWDDQWYSSFVFVPLLELNSYAGRKIFERTVVGVQFDSTTGSSGIKLSATSSDFQQNQLFANKLDRVSVRYTHFDRGTLYGASILTDSSVRGSQEQLVAFDVRHTIPHWIARGQIIGYRNNNERANGFFTEITHRKSGWEDLTLGLRYEGMLGFMNSNQWLFATTASAKIELEQQFTLQINYTFGPDMNRQPLGGGLAFGLSKTVRF
jgi:hypothetical protein